MKNKISKIFLLIIIVNNLAFTQNMTDGFNMLDNAQYDQAESFFTDILSEYPDNKTALICLGRATGLSGNTAEALTIFSKLKSDYPGDIEVKSNLAESLLWNKDYIMSIDTYTELKQQDTSSTSILLGLTNAYAAYAKYGLAHIEISDALNKYPNNEQIINSYKNITLAYAHQLKVSNSLQESKTLLGEYLKVYSKDPNGLKSAAYVYLALDEISQSKEFFESLLALDTHNDQALLGLASIALSSKDTNKAIAYCQHPDLLMSIQHDMNVKTQQLDILFGSYLESGKLKDASKTLEQLKGFISNDAYLEKLIYIKLIQEDYHEISEYISQIQDQKSSHRLALCFYMNKGDYKNARMTVNQMTNTELENKQVDHLVQSLKSFEKSNISATVDYNQDNGGYASKQVTASYVGSRTSFIQPSVQLISYQLKNQAENLSFTRHQVSTGLNLRFNKKHTTALSIGFQLEKYNAFAIQDQVTFKLSHQLALSKRQFIKVSLESAKLPVNYELINERINQDLLQIEHHIITKSNFGSYTSLTVNQLSDGNVGTNFFNSLYYNIKSTPLLQVGINTNIISYKDTKTDYYSPDRLISMSAFAKISNEYVQNKKWAYSATVSLGKQTSGDNNMSQITYYANTEIGYHFTDDLKLSTYGEYSKSDSANHFEFMRYQIGVRLNYNFAK